ncbi:MAG: aldehyde dehydrogenase [Candidatus Dependentiae bacterium]|nr:aldehyde dehydrogenase [Candidatus Dependentiae bacterium]
MNEYISTLIEQQHTFFSQGSTRDITFRIQQLIRLKEVIISHKEEILAALATDLNKPDFEAYTNEIAPLLSSINHVLGCLGEWCKPIPVKTPLIFLPARSMITYEPYGLTLIISPWNYPFHLSLEPLIGAIAAGNCAIIKPSEYAPASSAIIEKIIRTAFPSVYIAVVIGDGTIAEELLSHQFDYIFFTGSSAVGKKVMQAASLHITPLTLELGGKSPCIVSNDAHLKSSAKKIVWAKFLNAGQSCVAPDYLLVDASVKEELISYMKQYITDFFGDNPLHSPDYGRIVNQKQLTRLKGLLQNGTVRHGGTIVEQERYIAPTLLDEVPLDTTSMQEEIFGPILPIISYTSITKAVAIIKQLPKPLAIYVFTNSKQVQNIITSQTTSGALCINEIMVQAASPYLPFGGVGASGFGRYHGKKSFETFSNMRTVIKSLSFCSLPFRYPPYRWFHRWFRALYDLILKR